MDTDSIQRKDARQQRRNGRHEFHEPPRINGRPSFGCADLSRLGNGERNSVKPCYLPIAANVIPHERQGLYRENFVSII